MIQSAFNSMLSSAISIKKMTDIADALKQERNNSNQIKNTVAERKSILKGEKPKKELKSTQPDLEELRAAGINVDNPNIKITDTTTGEVLHDKEQR